MTESLPIRKLLDFQEIMPGWTLIQVTVHWNGDPILLFEEGRGPFPVSWDENTISRWYQTIPVAHHVIHLRSDGPQIFRIPNTSQAKLTRFAQPFRDGWLLADSRGGCARIYDARGRLSTTIDVGDAINDLQTTQNGLIWASYFDEGVFGGGIGASGLVCFDPEGSIIFRFDELASFANLPHIDDCYALNVCEDRVWFSYYTDFPLVCLKDFKVEKLWESIAAFKAFAIRQNQLLCVPAYVSHSVLSIDLETGTQKEVNPIDQTGNPLKDFKGRNYSYFASDKESLKRYKPFAAAGRDTKLYLYTEETLYDVLD